MAQVLQDVKEDGTSYDRLQPKPVLAPVRPLGTATPRYGQPQAPVAPLQPIQERGQVEGPGSPMVNPPAPQTSRLPGLPPKQNAGTLPEDRVTPGSSGPETPAPQPPAGPNIIPPPPPPVGTVPGGPMVNPGVPGAMQPPSTGGPMVQPPAPGSTGTPTPPATTGASIAPIVPGGPGDLRYQNITANDPRLGQTQGQVDTARDSLSSTPDRTELAAQALQLLRERTAPQYAQDQRAIGQSAAKFGRIGAGMTTNELTDLNLTRERDLDRTSRELANTAAGATMSDRLARLNALSGLEGQQFGQGQAGRDELRGERGYQNQTDQQARQDEIQRMLLEDQLLNSEFGRDQSRASLMGQLGFGQDPTGTLMGQGDYYGDQADASGAGTADLLRLWAESQAGGGAAAGAPVPPPNVGPGRVTSAPGSLSPDEQARQRAALGMPGV